MVKCGKIRKIKRAIGDAMKEIIDNLKSNEILYEQSIDILKNYIATKYPDENKQFRARVFADAVHKILDDHIKEFRRDEQKAIKKDLLTTAVQTNSFEINAYDILKTCVALELEEEIFAEDLANWINHQQDIPIEPSMVHEITEVVKEEMRHEAELDEAFELLEHEVEVSLERDIAEQSYAQGLTNQFEADLMAQLEAAFMEVEVEKPVVKEQEAETESLNMFNLADTIYSENRDEHDLLDEDRPVIKIERERQMDVLTEFEELEAETIPILTYREQIQEWLESGRAKRDLKTASPFIIGFVAIVILLYILVTTIDVGSKETIPEEAETSLFIDETEVIPQQEALLEEATFTKAKRMDGSNLHRSIQHKEIDQVKLKAWLVRRNSLLAEEKYFDILIEVAEDYDVNPLLLFAITGQEQNFVQRDHEDALEMINNPFNVYVSWEDFNTNLLESTQIASKTIHTLSEGLPEGEDPIWWINENGYAEDQRWHEGVSLILEQLEVVVARP